MTLSVAPIPSLADLMTALSDMVLDTWEADGEVTDRTGLSVQ